MREISDSCPHFPRGVPDGHICDVKGVIVGEAPGDQEMMAGVPFVGPSGHLLNRTLEYVGLSREYFYLTNVVPWRPTHEISRVGQADLGVCTERLFSRIRTRVPGRNLIVAVGNTSLRACTDKDNVSKWRGSLIKGAHGDKTIGTLHPAFVLREPSFTKTFRRDWARVADDINFPQLHLPERLHVIYPTRAEVEAFVLAASEAKTMSIDIETGRDGTIICVGFSIHPSMSITLEWKQFQSAIKALCENETSKVLQNGMFDYWHLFRAGIGITNYTWDVGAMFHALDPNAGPTSSIVSGGEGGGSSRIKCYSLAYMASIFTREPYWKDEAKEDSTGTIVRHSPEWWDTFLTYNGKDAAVTLELQGKLKTHLKEANRLDFYRTQYAALFYPLIRLMLRGVRIDTKGAGDVARNLVDDCAVLKREIESIAGKPLHSRKVGKTWFMCDTCEGRHKTPLCRKGGRTLEVPGRVDEGKSISTTLLQNHLYTSRRDGGLGLPKRRNGGRLTADESALRSLALTHGESCGPLISKVMEFREKEKLSAFVSAGIFDADGRVRSQYKMLVQTGRLSSSRNPSGTGMNLQNTDRRLMYLFRPEPGHIFVKVDLSQAEDRVVKALIGTDSMLKEARALPGTYDTHREMAAKIFTAMRRETVLPADVTGEMRYLGKRIVHAGNYGMQGHKLAEVLLKDGGDKVYTIKECDEMLAALHAVKPELRNTFQRAIRHEIRTKGRLTNSWKAVIEFPEFQQAQQTQREEIFRRGYAWIPQGEVGRLMNQYGVIPLDAYIEESLLDWKLVLQRHDEVVVSVPIDEAYDCAHFIINSLERPRLYRISDAYEPHELTIWTELSIALNGGKDNQIEFQRLPNRLDFSSRLNALLDSDGTEARLH